jgi:isopropylmalate/homocitrate/citramalate synthase
MPTQGYENAVKAGAKDVAVFAAASESFSKKNLNCTVAESLQRFEPILSAAKSDGVAVRGCVVVTCCSLSSIPITIDLSLLVTLLTTLFATCNRPALFPTRLFADTSLAQLGAPIKATLIQCLLHP